MEYKSLLELKNVDDATGEFSGYLAVFGNVDSDSDVIVKGAFKVSLASGRIIPILWQHIIEEPIGVWLELVEDDHGLLAKGKLAIDTPQGARAYSLLKMRAITGLSIGYKTVQFERLKGVRYLKEVKLFEGSIVTFEANSEAGVTEVKKAKTKSVDGVNLHSSAFAFVGDPSKPETWKLPIHFPTPEQSAAHIRDALSRFSETEGIPDSEKPRVLARIHAAADSHGIDKNKAAHAVAETKMKTFKDALASNTAEQEMRDQRWNIEDAKSDSLDSIMSDKGMTKEEKKAAVRKTMHDAADAHADILDRHIDSMVDEDADDTAKNANLTLEQKAAIKSMDSAIGCHVEGARKCMKAVDMIHQGLALHTKGIVMARQLSYAGIVSHDDKNAMAAAGKKAAEEALELADLVTSIRKKIAA